MDKTRLENLVRECVREVLSEGIFDTMMQSAETVQIPSHLKHQLLAAGNVLAGGYEKQVSDDVKIAAAIAYYMSGEKTNMFDTATTFHTKGIQ